MRFVRALWPVVFLIPLSWWADRGCRFVGVDPLYHSTLWIHERLGWFVGALALVSAAVVVAKIVVARRRFARLKLLAEPPPARLRNAIERASVQLGIVVPTVLYLDVAIPVASTVFRRTVLFSRGFIEPLDDADLDLVARHEIAHVQRHDATSGILWHLAFAALLIPGFEPLERRLHAQRERAANVAAANGREERYVALVGRVARGADVCAEARLGLEAAARRPGDRWFMWFAPLTVAGLAVALPLSHAAFRHDLPYLLAHHC